MTFTLLYSNVELVEMMLLFFFSPFNATYARWPRLRGSTPPSLNQRSSARDKTPPLPAYFFLETAPLPARIPAFGDYKETKPFYNNLLSPFFFVFSFPPFLAVLPSEGVQSISAARTVRKVDASLSFDINPRKKHLRTCRFPSLNMSL